MRVVYYIHLAFCKDKFHLCIHANHRFVSVKLPDTLFCLHGSCRIGKDRHRQQAAGKANKGETAAAENDWVELGYFKGELFSSLWLLGDAGALLLPWGICRNCTGEVKLRPEKNLSRLAWIVGNKLPCPRHLYASCASVPPASTPWYVMSALWPADWVRTQGMQERWC